MGLEADLNDACHTYEHYRVNALLATAEGVAAYNRLRYLLSNTVTGSHEFRGIRYNYQARLRDVVRIMTKKYRHPNPIRPRPAAEKETTVDRRTPAPLRERVRTAVGGSGPDDPAHPGTRLDRHPEQRPDPLRRRRSGREQDAPNLPAPEDAVTDEDR